MSAQLALASTPPISLRGAALLVDHHGHEVLVIPYRPKPTIWIAFYAEHRRLLLRLERRATALRVVAPCVLVLAGARLADDLMRQPRAARMAALLHGDVVVADRRRTVGRCARAGRCGRLGREGRGKPALRNIPAEPCHVGELVIGHRRADRAGDGQEQRNVFWRKPVRAALLEEEAVPWASAEGVPLRADTAFSHVTYPAGACGDGEGTDLDRWGCCGHLCSSSGTGGVVPRRVAGTHGGVVTLCPCRSAFRSRANATTRTHARYCAAP